MSAGIRSGVNWMRWNDRFSVSASVEISSVFARPGTPTNSVWPRANSATSSCSITVRWPMMRFSISCRIWSCASASSATASRSLFGGGERGRRLGASSRPSRWSAFDGRVDSASSRRSGDELGLAVDRSRIRRLRQVRSSVASAASHAAALPGGSGVGQSGHTPRRARNGWSDRTGSRAGLVRRRRSPAAIPAWRYAPCRASPRRPRRDRRPPRAASPARSRDRTGRARPACARACRRRTARWPTGRERLLVLDRRPPRACRARAACRRAARACERAPSTCSSPTFSESDAALAELDRLAARAPCAVPPTLRCASPRLLDLRPRQRQRLGDRAPRALAIALRVERVADALVADLAVHPADQRVDLGVRERRRLLARQLRHRRMHLVERDQPALLAAPAASSACSVADSAQLGRPCATASARTARGPPAATPARCRARSATPRGACTRARACPSTDSRRSSRAATRPSACCTSTARSSRSSRSRSRSAATASRDPPARRAARRGSASVGLQAEVLADRLPRGVEHLAGEPGDRGIGAGRVADDEVALRRLHVDERLGHRQRRRRELAASGRPARRPPSSGSLSSSLTAPA